MEYLLCTGIGLILLAGAIAFLGAINAYKFNSPVDNFMHGLFKWIMFFGVVLTSAGLILLGIMAWQGVL
jgi:hypothetical protein